MDELTDDCIMPFGTHKGKTMEKVPAQWLLWLYDNQNENQSVDSLRVIAYVEENMDVLLKQVRR